MYSDGGSQGHFPGRQGHPQHLCGPLQALTAAGPQAPGSRLVPTLAPRGHFQMTWSLPSGAPHHPRRNPTLLSLELQAPPAPSLPAPLGLTHICTHLHMHSAHTLTIDAHTHMHTLPNTCTYTHTLTCTQSHMYTRDCLHSHACSLLHTQTFAFTLLQMYTRALAPPTSPRHTLAHKHTCALRYILAHVCSHEHTHITHLCVCSHTCTHVCMHQRTRAHVSIPITHTSCAH